MECPICKRDVERLTRHHIIPKSKGGREKVMLCSDCHRQIHAMFSRSELKRYGSLEALFENEKFRRYVDWIRRHQPKGRIRIHRR